MLAAFAGVAVACQSRVNGELGVRLGDGLTAAALSNVVGVTALAVAVGCSPAGRRGLRRVVQAARSKQLRPWELCGGLAGALVVASQGIAAATLGIAVFSVALVAGQLVASLPVDRYGLGPGAAEPVTRRRLLGAAVAVAAVALAVSDRLAAPGILLLALLPLLAGVGVAWQGAVNGRVRQAAASSATAAFVNFAVGTVVLVGISAVRLADVDALPAEPWLYGGGLLGAAVVAALARAVRATGVLLLGLALVAGQVSGALALDLVVPAAGSRVSAATVTGILLALAAVAVGSRREPAPTLSSRARPR